MREIFPKGHDKEHMKVKRRIHRMAKHGLFEIDEISKRMELKAQKVKNTRIKISGKIRECICFCDDGKWSAFEI